MARPRKQVDLNLLEGLARIGCTGEEMGSILGCSKDTLERRFAATIEKGRSEMKMSLRRTQIRLAENGNATMAIWLGKQYLGQRDNVTFRIEDIDAEIERRLAELASRGQAATAGETQSEAVH